MRIAKHNTDFGSSEIMRSFEQVAIKKGIAEPTSIVKEASVESYQPSGSMLDDMLKLANGLRSKGYLKEAIELEGKIFTHKLAADMYDVSGETGDEFVDAAHPEGDVEIIPADEGLGIVETILTRHKKIEDSVKKEPTGKYAQMLPAGKMAIEYAKSMNSLIGMTEEDVYDIAQPAINAAMEHDMSGKSLNEKGSVISYVAGVLSEYSELWAQAINESNDKEAAVATYAEDAFAKAYGRWQNDYGDGEGKYSAADNDLVKNAKSLKYYIRSNEDSTEYDEEISELQAGKLIEQKKSEAASRAREWATSMITLAHNTVNTVGEKNNPEFSADDLRWNSIQLFSDWHEHSINSDAVDAFEELLSAFLVNQVEIKNKDPKSHVDKFTPKFVKSVLSAAKNEASEDNDPPINVFDFVYTWASSDDSFIDVADIYRAVESTEVVEKPKKKNEYDIAANTYVKALNIMINGLHSYIKRESNEENMKRAEKAIEKFTNCKVALNQKLSDREFTDLKDALRNISITKAENAASLDDLDTIMNEQYESYENFVSKAGVNNALIKNAQGGPNMPGGAGAPKPNSKYKWERGNQSTKNKEDTDPLAQPKKPVYKPAPINSYAKPIKDQLTQLAELLKDDAEAHTALLDQNTTKAIEAANAVKDKYKVNVQPIPPGQNAQTLEGLKKLYNALSSGGSTYQARNSLGKYLIRGNKEVDISTRDVMSLADYLRMLESTGLINDYMLGNDVIVPNNDSSKVAELVNLFYKLAQGKYWETHDRDGNKLNSTKPVSNQPSDVVNPWPEEDPTSGLLKEFQYGLNIKQWSEALKDARNAGYDKLKNPNSGPEDRQNAARFIQSINVLVKKLVEIHKAQNKGKVNLQDDSPVPINTPNDELDEFKNGEGLPYKPKPKPGHKHPYGNDAGVPDDGVESEAQEKYKMMQPPIGETIDLRHPIWERAIDDLKSEHGDVAEVFDALGKEIFLKYHRWDKASPLVLAEKYASGYESVPQKFWIALQVLPGVFSGVRREWLAKISESTLSDNDRSRIDQVDEWSDRWATMIQRQATRLKNYLVQQ